MTPFRENQEPQMGDNAIQYNTIQAAGGGRTNVLVNRVAGDCLQRGSLEGGRTRAVPAEPIPVKVY